MIYTDLTKKAHKIAYKAHLNQVDKAGMPYIFHPVYIAEQMRDEITTTVALLHDVIEDTNIRIETLEQEFPEIVINALKAITRNKNEAYFDYIERVKENGIARKVKVHDLIHNLDETRFDKVTQQIRTQNKRYRKALEILL